MIFSAERPRSAVTATSERFGAGIAGRRGSCQFSAPNLHPLDPFETKPGRAGASRTPGLLTFPRRTVPLHARRGAQPVLQHGPVPPPHPKMRRRPATATSRRTRWPWRQAPSPATGRGRLYGPCQSGWKVVSRKCDVSDVAGEFCDNRTIDSGIASKRRSLFRAVGRFFTAGTTRSQRARRGRRAFRRPSGRNPWNEGGPNGPRC